MAISKWSKVERSFKRLNWKNDFVTCCYVGKVFHVLRHRNSYNWSCSVNYFVEHAFYPNLNDAKSFVEARREKGSSWTIEEYPAIVIKGSHYCLCVASKDHGKQFRSLQNIEIPHKNLAKIAATLIEFGSTTTFVYRTRCNEVSALTSPLCRYSSRSSGGDYLLGWIERRADVQLSSIFELQKTIWKLL